MRATACALLLLGLCGCKLTNSPYDTFGAEIWHASDEVLLEDRPWLANRPLKKFAAGLVTLPCTFKPSLEP